MAACLHARGYPGGRYEVPGLHNLTTWRDAFARICTCCSGSSRAPMDRHLIGLLLGTEEDWPTAFETLMRAARPGPRPGGAAHAFATERITIEPFNLRDKPRHDLVIDRLAYWYYHPREWLKKVALMDDVYLLNSPFTFQSMEKHAAYCAMMRLGLQGARDRARAVQEPGGPREYAYTADRYNQPFDLDAIAEQIGYPLFMKPYDGGALARGVPHRQPDELHARLRPVRRDADAPAGVGRRLRRVRPVPVHRRGDDGDAVPARTRRCTRGTPSSTTSSTPPPGPRW